MVAKSPPPPPRDRFREVLDSDKTPSSPEARKAVLSDPVLQMKNIKEADHPRWSKGK